MAHRQSSEAPSQSTDSTPGTKKVWLDAWTDPVAGVQAYSPCMHTIDLFGDGEWRLVVADVDKKLKVWRGTHLASEHALLDNASAITSFYSENKTTAGKLPSLAVAAGPHVYIYRNLRPYYKFTLACETPNAQEQSVWNDLSSGSVGCDEGAASLAQLKDSGVSLTRKSNDYLALEDTLSREEYVDSTRAQCLVEQTVITCMTTIKRGTDEADAVGNIVLGTESGHVITLDNSATKEGRKIQIGSPPAYLAVEGLFGVHYRIFAACRDGKVYCIKDTDAGEVLVELEAQAVGLLRVNTSLLVGCMNDVIHSYDFKGRKQYSLYLPASVQTMCLMEVSNQRLLKCMAVALSNGEIRVYHEKHLASVHSVTSPVTGLCFGRYGREENTLVAALRNGTLDIKILPRMANLDSSGGGLGPPPEQDIPLNIPKKTKLYVEQTQREVEQAVDMHRIFQRDLCKLRLRTARAYVKVLTDGQGALSFTTGSQLQMNAIVHGLGPSFKIKLDIKNTGREAISDLTALLRFNETLYNSDRKCVAIPLLLSGLLYQFEVRMRCLDPMAGAGEVNVALVDRWSVSPLLLALVKMPVSETEEMDE